jgi:hypothetical protein
MKKLPWIEELYIRFFGPCSKYSMFREGFFYRRVGKKLRAFQLKEAEKINDIFNARSEMPPGAGRKAIERAKALIKHYETKEWNMQFEYGEKVGFDLSGFKVFGTVSNLQDFEKEIGYPYPSELDGVLVKITSFNPTAPNDLVVGEIVEVRDKLEAVDNETD